MLSDFRFALRQLVRSPGFTIVAVATLALGIGLNAAIFSVVNGIFLRPLPYAQPDRLYRLYRTTPQRQNGMHSNADYLDLARAAAGTMQLGAFRLWSFTLTEPGRPPRQIEGLRVSADYLRTLGLPPEAGRMFVDEEDRAEAEPVAILSHRLWEREFGSDPGIVGRNIRLSGRPTTIVGVMPASFWSMPLWGPADIICPLRLTAEERRRRTDAELKIIGRVAPGVTAAAAEAKLQAIAAQLARDHPAQDAESSVRFRPLSSAGVIDLVDTFRRLSWLTLALSGSVLLITCANLANLQLSRAVRRMREYAVRAALGASRARLMRPLVCECLLLSIVGGVFGTLVMLWADAWLVARMAPIGFELSLDWRVFAFAFGASLATGLLFGLAPAAMMSRVPVNEILKSGARGATGGRSQARFRGAMIIGQFALALVLLSGAGFFQRGAARLLARDPGWNTGNLLSGIISLPEARYTESTRTYGFYRQLEERIAALPGVEKVGMGWTMPILEYLKTRSIVVEGRPLPAAGHEPLAYFNGVSPTFLDTLGVRLVNGRWFAETDNAKAPLVAIINESLARALFPGENPVGRRLRGVDVTNPQWIEIVGVVHDVQFAASFGTPATPFQIYIPLAQDAWTYVSVVVRTSTAPAALAEPLRQVVAGLDPDLPVQQLAPVNETIESIVENFTRSGSMLAGLAGLGLFLAALGIYGVISTQVAQRTPEIGVRMALGAPTQSVVWLVLSAGLRLALIGVGIGLLGTYLLGQVFHRVSPEMPAQDLPLAAAITGVLVVVAIVASGLPARRATKVDPIAALRAE